MGLGSTLSVAVTVKVTMAPEGAVASAWIEGGTVRTGGVVSITVTWNNPVTVFPWESDAEQTTFVVTKTGKIDPEAGEHATATGPSTRSVAEAEYVTTAPLGPVAEAVISAGRVSAGAVVSWIVMVEDAEPTLPAASLAAHVTVVVPSGKVEPELGEQIAVSEPLTMSVADAEKVATAPLGPVASRVSGNPENVTVGGVVSTIVILKLVVALLPEKSVAEQETSVVPSANVEPEAGEQLTVGEGSTKSLTVGGEYVMALPDGPVASATILVGATIEGGVVSRTVTVKVPWIELPEESVAVQDTIVVPRAKVEPDVGEQTTLGVGSTMSAAVTEKVTAAPLGAVASAVMPAGRDRTGGVVSTTVTLKLALALLLEKSVAEHWTRVNPSVNVEPDC